MYDYEILSSISGLLYLPKAGPTLDGVAVQRAIRVGAIWEPSSSESLFRFLLDASDILLCGPGASGKLRLRTRSRGPNSDWPYFLVQIPSNYRG